MIQDASLVERAQKFVKYGNVTEKNVEQLRKLNFAVFPVRYNDKFYTDLASSKVQDYTHLAYFSDILVGAIAGRVEPQKDIENACLHLGNIPNHNQADFAEHAFNWPERACQGSNGVGFEHFHTGTSRVGPSTNTTGSELDALALRVEGSKFKIYIMTIGVLAPYRRLGIGTMLLQLVLDACSKQPDCEQVYLHVQVNNDDAIDFYKRFGFTVGEVVKDYYKRIEPPDAVILSRTAPFPELAVKPPQYA